MSARAPGSPIPGGQAAAVSAPVLGLDASTLRPSAALVAADGERLESWCAAEGTRGTAALAAAVGELLAARGLSVTDLAGVAVGTGPGSYTGLRSAIALARALVLPSGARLAAVPSVAAAAWGQLREHAELDEVTVVLDARRGELYRADYRRSPDQLVSTVLAPCLVRADDALPPLTPARLVVREPLPDAYDVAVLGRARLVAGGDDPAAVLPLYLKRSHAEIALEERKNPS